jgi:PP-loop superfamily ATP-utilizing enzyme
MKMKQELKIFNTFMTMKTSKYIIPALLFMAAVGVNAQTVDQNVTVEREYQPVIQDAGKISLVPEIIEPAVEKTTAR